MASVDSSATRCVGPYLLTKTLGKGQTGERSWREVVRVRLAVVMSVPRLLCCSLLAWQRLAPAAVGGDCFPAIYSSVWPNLDVFVSTLKTLV